jgi:2,3-bisphosphoglycerate-independent phosphoglycerate mutase
LDNLVHKGISGLIDPVETGLACGSDTAHLSLFSYNPFIFYKGRGAFEVLGSGLQMQKSDIGFKSNFAHHKDNIAVLRRVDSIEILNRKF